jgi:bacteriocin-like protein
MANIKIDDLNYANFNRFHNLTDEELALIAGGFDIGKFFKGLGDIFKGVGEVVTGDVKAGIGDIGGGVKEVIDAF